MWFFSRDRDGSPPPEKSVHGMVVTPEASWGNGWKIQPSNVAVTLSIVASISAHYNYYDWKGLFYSTKYRVRQSIVLCVPQCNRLAWPNCIEFHSALKCRLWCPTMSGASLGPVHRRARHESLQTWILLTVLIWIFVGVNDATELDGPESVRADNRIADLNEGVDLGVGHGRRIRRRITGNSYFLCSLNLSPYLVFFLHFTAFFVRKLARWNK